MALKPVVKLPDVTEPGGNVFNIISIVKAALRKHGMPDRAEEFQKKAFESESYEAVLELCKEYVQVRDAK